MNQKIKLLPQKMHFRTWVNLKIALSKNTFQNMGELKNCSLEKKMHFRTWMGFLKNAPAKNKFQNMGDF